MQWTVEEAEEDISALEIKVMENTYTEQKRERIIQHETSLRELSDSIQCKMFVSWESHKKERTKSRNLFEEIIDENSPNLGKETHSDIWTSVLKVLALCY